MDYSRGYVEPSKLPGNPFADEGALYTEDANNSSVVNATLALAYEQRTANLLALWAKPAISITDSHTGNEVTWGIDEDRIGKLLEEILERLGGKP
jgi:hypothetical protein